MARILRPLAEPIDNIALQTDKNINKQMQPQVASDGNHSQKSSVDIPRIMSDTCGNISKAKERRHKVKYRKRAHRIAPILSSSEVELTQTPKNRVTRQSADEEESSLHPNRVRLFSIDSVDTDRSNSDSALPLPQLWLKMIHWRVLSIHIIIHL